MKYKTTQKEIRANYPIIISASYCSLQHLLKFREPQAYTVRREGWAADVYDLGGGIALTTGYAPFGTIKADYDICQTYDNRAAEVLKSRSADGNGCRKALDNMISDFVGDLCRE